MTNYSKLKLITTASIIGVIMIVNACDYVYIWPAEAITNAASGISQANATLNGQAIIDNSTKIGFEYGTTLAYGNTIYPISNSIIVGNYTSASCPLTSLLPKTSYHYRMKLENRDRIIYGNDVMFTTLDYIIVFNPNVNYGSVSDIDGNTYKTIQIGTQTWMAENLRTTKYNDGTSIMYNDIGSNWLSIQAGAYGWLNHEEAKFKFIYGGYYNWYAVNSNQLCPSGWHVPSDSEWEILASGLGGEINLGKKINETGGNHWLSSGSNITNESGFTALPGGYCNFSGIFKPNSDNGFWMGNEAYWWTSSESIPGSAFFRVIYSNSTTLLMGSWIQEMGLSVRCLKDN